MTLARRAIASGPLGPAKPDHARAWLPRPVAVPMARRSSRRAPPWCLLLGIAALCSAAAAAAPSGSSGAPLAESLFREAKQLATAGKYDEACPKFAESQQIDPQLGTLLHLATCHEQQGKIATAWAEFGEAADWAERAKDARREQIARGRVRALEPRLAHLKIEIAAPAAGLSISLDGSPLGAASLATPLPVDPGEHELRATAPDAQPWTKRVVAPEEGAVRTVRVPPLEPAGEQGSRGRGDGRSSDGASGEGDGEAQRIAGWIIGGVGLAGIVVMAIFGLRASDQADDADIYCSGRYCTEQGLDLHAEASTSADVATAAFFVGVACLGAGLTLVLTAPSSDGSAPVAAPDAGASAARRAEASLSLRPVTSPGGRAPAGAAAQVGLTW